MIERRRIRIRDGVK